MPGIQGRWEWMRPCAEGLAGGGRVVTASLPGEPGSGFPVPERFDVHVDYLDAIFERAGLESAVLCGVSYGGWVSVHYAARRPERVKALILASAPGPSFKPDTRQEFYARAPRLLAPAFAITAHRRMQPEVKTALPNPHERRAFRRGQYAAMLRYPLSPSKMARRLAAAMREDFEASARAVTAPTLVLTGEPGLDLVVPVASTKQYLDFVPGARSTVLPETGHIGCVTRPREFADVVRSFVRDARDDRRSRTA